MKWIKYEFQLENMTPFKIGHDEEGSLKLRDVSQQYVLFGSSVAGFLKSLIDQNQLLGDEKNASKVKISDLVCIQKEVKILKRDGIRINSKTSTADEKGKYETYLLAEGHQFMFSLTMEASDANEWESLETLAKAIDSLSYREELLFGGGYTTGFGKMLVTEIRRTRINMDDFTQIECNELMNWPDIEAQKLSNKIQFEAKLQDSFLLGGQVDLYEEENKEQNKINLRERSVSYKESGQYKIPSSSIKGSMKNFCGKLGFAQEMESLFGNQNQRGILKIFDAKLKNVHEVDYHRIKIDRISGGVMDGAHVKESRLISKKTEEVNVHFQISFAQEEKLKPNHRKALLFYFRDLACGRISLGGGESVGCGRIIGVCLKIGDVAFKLDQSGFSESEISKLESWIEEGDFS